MYTLLLSLEYQKYHRPAEVLISLGDRTVDHFNLDSDLGLTNVLPIVEKKCFEKINKLYWIQRDNWTKEWVRRPKFYKVYQLNEDYLENSMIKISVENNNTDYTNGFMNKSSLLKIHTIALLPTAFLKNNAEKYFEILRKIDEGRNKFIRRTLNLVPEMSPAGEKTYLQKNPPASWPNVRSYMVKKEVGDPELSDSRFWIGGSFEIKIPVRQKHKIKYLGSASGRDYGFLWICNPDSFTIGSLKPLLNIYNENQ